jgi:hypothetical protein
LSHSKVRPISRVINLSLSKSLKHNGDQQYCSKKLFLGGIYSLLHQFWTAKFAYGGSISGWSQFLLLPQLLQKTKRPSKVVKIGLKIIISLQKSKFVKLSV